MRLLYWVPLRDLFHLVTNHQHELFASTLSCTALLRTMQVMDAEGEVNPEHMIALMHQRMHAMATASAREAMEEGAYECAYAPVYM